MEFIVDHLEFVITSLVAVTIFVLNHFVQKRLQVGRLRLDVKDILKNLKTVEDNLTDLSARQLSKDTLDSLLKETETIVMLTRQVTDNKSSIDKMNITHAKILVKLEELNRKATDTHEWVRMLYEKELHDKE